MEKAESYLARWQAAGLLDEQAAARIREWEAAQEAPAGRQWQVLLTLILGGILLGAGVLLFVAAHWDRVSPGARLLLVLGMLGFFHGLGLLTQEKFAGFATAMHALGTVSCGAAIALIGQIFNMQEHWPAAVLLWAMCAGAGWWLLRDQFQQTLTLLLVPAWICSEFGFRLEPYTSGTVYLARVGVVVGAALLAGFLHSRRRAVFGILFGVGALLLPVSIGVLADGWASQGYEQWSKWGFVPMRLRLAALGIVLLTAGVAWLSEKGSVVPVGIAAVLAYALPWLQALRKEDTLNGGTYTLSEPSVAAHALVAAGAVGLVAWGVRISSKALVNYGMAAFAASVMWFYFSSVMDKLGRSLGLIALGVLFLAGGWVLERTRRRLVGAMGAAHEA